MDRHTIIPAAYLILQKDDQYLLLQRANTGYQDGMYNLISGHVEQGEPFTTCIVREAMEEACINVKKENLVPYYVAHRISDDLSERIDVFFTSSTWEGEPAIGEPQKCGALTWFSKDALPENITPFIKEVLEKDDQTFFGEHNWK